MLLFPHMLLMYRMHGKVITLTEWKMKEGSKTFIPEWNGQKGFIQSFCCSLGLYPCLLIIISMQAYLESQHHHCMTQHTHAHMRGRTQAGICITDDGQKEGSRANTGIQTHHPFLFFPSYSTLPCRRFVRYDINSKPNPSILLCSPPPQKSTLQRRVPRTLLTTRRFTLTSPYHFTSSTF